MSMKRIAIATIAAISVLALLATAAGASSPRGRHVAPAKCLPVHSGLIAADAQAQVYERPVGGEAEVFFACAYGSRHTYNLGTGPPNISSQGGSENTDFTLGGAMLAYESSWFTSYPAPGAIECEADVVVKDLRTGRILHNVPTGTSSPPSLCFGPAITLVVKSDGAVAWISKDEEAHHPEPAPYEVHVVDKTGSQLLASSTEIEPYSLALGGSTLYWLQGGKPMSATLN
jgi:hypothetical protein